MSQKVDRKTRILFYVSFIPMVGLSFLACLVFGILLVLLINTHVSTTVLSSVTDISAKVYEKILPDIENTKVLSSYPRQENTKAYMDSAMLIFENYESVAASYHYAPVPQYSSDGLFFSISNGLGSTISGNVDWTQKEWFSGAVADTDKIYYCEPYVNSGLGKVTMSASITAKDHANKVIGVAAADIYIDSLNTIVKEYSISKAGKIYIVYKDGRFLTNEDAAKILKADFFETSKIGISAKQAFSEVSFTKIKSGTKYYGSHQIGDSPLYIVAEGPMSDFAGSFIFTMVGIMAGLVGIGFFLSVYNTKFIQKFQNKEKEMGQKLFVETQNLVVASKETAATSQDQNAAVKEIVATMEDTNNLSENIAAKIHDVNSVANKTTSDVADGAVALQHSIDKLHEISVANNQTIEGIKDLSKEVDNIWDIVSLITSVADQAKIIAFNAELEAASAGEAGKNFHIVASEIRRLADGIIDSTKEIKDRISGIQHSSDSLILASESGTVKVEEGVETAKELENRFASIKSAAEITAKSANEITTTIQQQTSASEQILVTLKQISVGVENFSSATESISSAAENLRQIAEKLDSSINDDGENE